MSKIVNFFKSNARQVFDAMILSVGIAFPWLINLQELFKEFLENNPPAPDNVWWHFALALGKPAASFVFFTLALIRIRRKNTEFVMNRQYLYHDYWYIWYWFCAKTLGISKCNLVLVPIHMQFKLVIRGTFAEYPLQDDDYPGLEDEPDCHVSTYHDDRNHGAINLILEDTYPIEERQLCKVNRDLYTIKISRGDKSNTQHFSQKFVDTIKSMLSKCGHVSVVNVFATTNPKNTLHIARRVFGSVDRGNVGHLYVFQQGKDGKRTFEENGYKVF